MTTALDLIHAAQCTAACLLAEADLDNCRCRCQGEHHGSMADAPLDAADNITRWQMITERFLRELPEAIRNSAEEAAEHDWYCAGEPDAPREEKLPDVLRHVGHILATRSRR